MTFAPLPEFMPAGDEHDGCEAMEPGDVVGWVPAAAFPLEWEARDEATRAMRELGICFELTPAGVELGAAEMALGDEFYELLPFVLKPVLMREQSEVEARIAGYEFPAYVECTERARAPFKVWRVELA